MNQTTTGPRTDSAWEAGGETPAAEPSLHYTWRSELPHWLLIGAMFLLAILRWGSAPDRMPVHWNIAGQVDGYGGKVEALLLVPCLALGLYWLFRILPRFDPGRANYPAFAGAYHLLRLTMMVFLFAVYLLTLSGTHDMGRFVNLLMGALFLVLGSILGKLRPNWFAGIRTPWTLSSKASWSKTHRLGGWLFMAAGVLIMLAGAFQTDVAVWTMLTALSIATLIPVIYSYFVWRDDPDKTPPAGTLPAE